MSVATFNNEFFGSNIRNVDVAPTVTGTGSIFPQFKPGSVTTGDCGGEFVYVGMNLAANQVLQEGQVVVFDNNFMGALLYAANTGGTVPMPSGANIKGANIGVVRISPSYVQPLAGLVYLWVQRAGIAPILVASGSAAGNLANTSPATAPGVLDLNAAGQSGSRQVTGITLAGSSAVVNGTTVNGSNQVTGVNLNAITPQTGLFVGMSIAGTGIPAGTTIAAIQAGPNNSYPVGVASSSAPGSLTNATLTLSQNATASGTVALTGTGLLEAYINWPYIA